jgi:hypothetical protein
MNCRCRDEFFNYLGQYFTSGELDFTEDIIALDIMVVNFNGINLQEYP